MSTISNASFAGGFVTLTTVTIYSRFDVKVENTQQLPSEIPLASFSVVLQGKKHTNI